MLEDRPGPRRSPWVVVLTCAVVVLWTIAVALPTWLLVVIAQLPGEDPGRAGRAFVIALGVFLSFALLAIGASAGLFGLRRHLRSDRSAQRPPFGGDPSERYNPLAIVGFALAFGPTLVGLVLSIVALVQIRRSGERGRGFAVAGVVVASSAMVIGTVLLIVLSRSDPGFFPGAWQ